MLMSLLATLIRYILFITLIFSSDEPPDHDMLRFTLMSYAG